MLQVLSFHESCYRCFLSTSLVLRSDPILIVCYKFVYIQEA
ncbi:hypothetical protein Hdeb2414_s0169g00821631 [Helianthus debilis subsp. tardiflorus]